jgi:glycosyltransferase involved in cell wall biosynthesis
MRTLRIAILGPTFLPKCSGAEVFHHNLAARLAAEGHTVTVVAPRSRVRQLRNEEWELPYSLEPYPDKRWGWLKRNPRFAFWLNRRTLSALQRKHRFDVWHAFVLYPAGVVLADWRRFASVPCVVRAVGDDVSGLPERGHATHVAAALRGKLPHADAVIALSEEMAREIAGLGVAREKIRIQSNAVDAGRFAPSAERRRTARAELGVPDSAFLFLCVARNHPQKDFATLLAAFRELRVALPGRDVRLVIAGRGAEALRPELGDLADCARLCEFGLERAARGVPAMPPEKLVDLYLAADAFVLSSLLEGFSSAIIEAMAAGLPLVVTDAPGIRGVVTDGQEGLLVPLQSPGQLASAMRRVVREESLRAGLSAASLASAARYSWPAVVSSYEALYRDLIDSVSRR